MTNQRLPPESQLGPSDSSEVEIQLKENQLLDRVVEAIGDESIASFSRRCGIGDSTLRKYLLGATPNAINLVAIADAANVNIEWLAAGRGLKLRGAPPATTAAEVAESIRFDDYDRLVLAINTVEAALAASNKFFSPEKHAQFIAISYKILADRDQRDNVVDIIKMAA